METALRTKPVLRFSLETDQVTSLLNTPKVPDLSGLLTVEEIQAALAEGGFLLGAVTPADGPGAAGKVISQSPAAGTRSAPGTPVTVVVGSGISVVPEVRGAPLQDATTLMNRAGFQVTSVAADAPNLEPGTVIAQSSDLNTLLPYGTVITLTIAAGGPSTDTFDNTAPRPQG